MITALPSSSLLVALALWGAACHASETRYDYDVRGRLVSTRTIIPDQLYPTLHYQYDEIGNVTLRSLEPSPYLLVSGMAAPSSVPLGNDARFVTTVTNAGSRLVGKGAINFSFSQPVRIIDLTSASGECDLVELSCSIVGLNVGQNLEVTLRAAPRAVGSVDLTVVATTLVPEHSTHRDIVGTISEPSPDPGDLDTDGIPNEWELANQLDPLFALDAGADPDHDGQNNLAEYGKGTNPHFNPAILASIIGRLILPPESGRTQAVWSIVHTLVLTN